MVYFRGLMLWVLALHVTELGTIMAKSKLQANKTYIGVRGRSLTLKWSYTGKQYQHASIYIVNESASSRGSQNFLKLWQVTYSSNDTVIKHRVSTPNSVFNNLTELVVRDKSVFYLTLKAIPRDALKLEFTCRVQGESDWVTAEEKQIAVMVAVPPVVTITVNRGNNLHVPKGTDVNVICSATGYPVPKIEIKKDAKRLAKAAFPSNEVTLKLTNVQPANAGRYVCSAQNIAGSTTEDTLITVTYIELRQKTPMQIFSTLGSSQALECPIDGYPPVIYSWFKGNKQVSGYRQSKVKLNRGDKFGNYSCVGQNDAGTEEVVFSIWMEGPKAGQQSSNGCRMSGASMTSLAASVLVLLLYSR